VTAIYWTLHAALILITVPCTGYLAFNYGTKGLKSDKNLMSVIMRLQPSVVLRKGHRRFSRK